MGLLTNRLILFEKCMMNEIKSLHVTNINIIKLKSLRLPDQFEEKIHIHTYTHTFAEGNQTQQSHTPLLHSLHFLYMLAGSGCFGSILFLNVPNLIDEYPTRSAATDSPTHNCLIYLFIYHSFFIYRL